MKRKPNGVLVAKIRRAMRGYTEGEKTLALAWILGTDVSENITPREVIRLCSIADAPLRNDAKANVPMHKARPDGSLVSAV